MQRGKGARRTHYLHYCNWAYVLLVRVIPRPFQTGQCVGVKIIWYNFSDPQASKDLCDHHIPTLKSHKAVHTWGQWHYTASDMEIAIESYGGVKGCYATVAKIQVSCQIMTIQGMMGIQALNNFGFKSVRLSVRKAYNLETSKCLSLY